MKLLYHDRKDGAIRIIDSRLLKIQIIYCGVWKDSPFFTIFFAPFGHAFARAFNMGWAAKLWSFLGPDELRIKKLEELRK